MMQCLVGLTGSIGMGKSTTAQMFRDYGVPVWDADATVHALYDVGGAAVPLIAQIYPQAIIDGAVNRGVLKDMIADDPLVLQRLEAIVHPLVADSRAAFITAHPDQMILFDIPLLFETKAQEWLDVVVTVSAPPDIQKRRVLERGNMTEEQFATNAQLLKGYWSKQPLMILWIC